MTNGKERTKSKMWDVALKIIPWALAGSFVLIAGLWADNRQIKADLATRPTAAEHAALKAKVESMETTTAAGIKRVEDRVNQIYNILIEQ